jgi:hypothetical protein
MKLLEFQMTGTAHSAGYKAHKAEIHEGDELVLERDPHNQYDTAAIKVLWHGEHIGWVPKKLGEAKAMLDKLLVACYGGELACWLVTTVESHEPDNPVDMQLTVSVAITEEE